MSVIKQFISRIPYWAFLLMLLVIFVNVIYLRNMNRIAFGDVDYRLKEGRCVIAEMSAWGPTSRAGLKPGDVVLFIDSVAISGPEQSYTIEGSHAIGDTLTYIVSRNNDEYTLTRIITSYVQEATVMYYIKFLMILFFSCLSVFILYKKPSDQSVRLFFIFFQLHAIFHIAYFLHLKDLIANFATLIWLFSVYLTGPVLIHFILIFPRPALSYTRFRRLPVLLYSIGCLLASFFFTCYLLFVYVPDSEAGALLMSLNRMHSSWIGLTCCIAIVIAIFQFREIKNTIARNQLRMVITGAFFGFSVPSAYAVFYYGLFHLNFLYPFVFYEVAQEITIIIMIICFLIALLRYRIWDIELYFKKALLYLGATIVITLSYFLLIFLVNHLSEGETDVIRFMALAVSVIIFLVLRDRLQQLIDRLFHREAYDSATVVADFEEKLAGIYRFEELKARIVQGLDDIFHFKSLVFIIKKEALTYEPAYSLGQLQTVVEKEYKVTPELEQRLQKSNVFSPAELDQNPSVPEMTNGELVVPLLKENKPYGFFLCGTKKSELTYSLQDIRVLSLIAKRVIALFNTAGLYQKDLDRQLMLERERARISQDMHDDIGAGLTRIAMISETGFKTSDQGQEVRERMAKVASSSRDMIARLNVIVWALNPRYDNLDSLISYSRRYFGEYLDNFGIHFIIKVPDIIPQLSITPDFRRNVFYTLQEAIHNAVKHGDPSEIKLQMLINGNKIEITVTDNGKGFETDSGNNHGNGLLNMKKRADDICGLIDIQSLSGHGTTVRLIFNLNENTTKG